MVPVTHTCILSASQRPLTVLTQSASAAISRALISLRTVIVSHVCPRVCSEVVNLSAPTLIPWFGPVLVLLQDARQEAHEMVPL